jgi:hypothetical protein
MAGLDGRTSNQLGPTILISGGSPAQTERNHRMPRRSKREAERRAQVREARIAAVPVLLYSRQQTRHALGEISLASVIRLENQGALDKVRLAGGNGAVYHRAEQVHALCERAVSKQMPRRRKPRTRRAPRASLPIIGSTTAPPVAKPAGDPDNHSTYEITAPTTDCSIEIAIPSTTNTTTVPFRPQKRPVRRETDRQTTTSTEVATTTTNAEIIPPGQLTRAEYVEHIWAAYARTVAAIIEVGLWLIKARNNLPHGEFEAMVREDLPFLPPYAYKLRTVAANPVLSNPSHGKDLPPSVATLYELTFIKDEPLLALIESGKITPKLERAAAHALRPPKKKKCPARPHVPEHADESALPPDEWSDGTPTEQTDEAETNPANPDRTVDPATDANAQALDDQEIARQQPAISGDPIAACLAEVVPIIRAALVRMDAEKRSVFFDELRRAVRSIVTEVTAQDVETDHWAETTH